MNVGHDSRTFGLSPQRLCHPYQRNGDAAAIVSEPLDWFVSAGPVKGFARLRAGEFHAAEAFSRGTRLAQGEKQPPDTASRECRVGVHGADPCSVGRWIEKGGIPAWSMIAAVKRIATAPAAASSEDPTGFDYEIGPVIDELGVESHDRSARGDLIRAQEAFLEFVNRSGHQFRQSRQIMRRCYAMAKVHT
jgi:hypothetical protein